MDVDIQVVGGDGRPSKGLGVYTGTRARGRALTLLLMIGLVLTAVAASPAGAARPACEITNDRTHAASATLQAAVDAAAAGDSIEVKGTCAGSTTIGKDIRIKGVTNKPFGTATLTGMNAGRVLRINAGTTTVRRLTITGGLAGDGGGIIVRSGAAARVEDSVVAGNTATGFGGGIEVFPTGTLAVTGSVVRNNAAGSSGGIDSDHGTVTVVSSAVRDNTASGATNCSDIGSCAGGLWNFGGTMTLADTTITGNTASYRGGGIVEQTPAGEPDAVLTLRGATSISANHAGDVGGGVHDRSGVYEVSAWTGSVFDNVPDQCFPAVAALNC